MTTYWHGGRHGIPIGAVHTAADRDEKRPRFRVCGPAYHVFPTRTLGVCCLTTKNGFTVSGAAVRGWRKSRVIWAVKLG